MNKFMNNKDSYVDDSLSGILKAHSRFLKCAPGNKRAIIRADAPIEGKVAIVTGGGYGHLPLFLGYVGEGLCDACAVGDVFSPPTFDAIWAATKRVTGKAGVLFLFGNYFNDSISFMLAADMADLEGIPNATIKICDDISSGKDKKLRRGIAGCYFAYKIAGACAQEGHDLKCVQRIAERTVQNSSTYGVATSSCQLPSSRQPLFEIVDGEMELGAGIHGEHGTQQHTVVSSWELVRLMLPGLIQDQQLAAGNRVALLVNGLGGATQEDLYIVYNDAAAYIESQGVEIRRSFVGEYATSMETTGLSITLLKLDEELEHYLDAGASSPLFPMV